MLHFPHTPRESGIGLRPTPIAGGSTRIFSEQPGATEALALAPEVPSIRRKLEVPAIQRKSEAVAARRAAAGGVPQFEDNPLAAIGFVLSNVAAGFQGRELPSAKAQKAIRDDRALRLKGLGVRINALKFGIETCGDLEGEERQECIRSLGETVGDLDPDFATKLEATIGTPKARDIAALALHPAALEFLNSDFFESDDERFKFATSEAGQKKLQDLADTADRPALEAMLDEIFPGIAATVPENERGNVGVTPSMIRELHRQGKIPDRYKLTENMLSLLEREPELLDDRAQRHGFLTAAEVEAAGLAAAKRAPGDKFSEPYEDDAGNTVQKNLASGEIKVISKVGAEKATFSEPYTDDAKNLVQKNLVTNEIKVISKAKAEKETFSAPYEDPIGNLVQKNIDTNKIHVISKAGNKAKFSQPFTDDAGNLVQENLETGEIKILTKAAVEAQFGPPRTDEAGNLVQKNLNTGEIKVLTKAKGKAKFGPPRTDDAGNLVQENLETNEVKILTKAAAPKGRAVNILLPNGTRATGRELPDGKLMVVGEGGVLKLAPPGSLKMAVQAAPGQLPDATTRREALQIEVTTRNFVALAQKTVDFLADPKLVLGGAGSTIVFAQGLLAQARQLGQAFTGQHFDGTTGKGLTLAQILDPTRYNFEGMRAVAAATTRTRANIIAMAYIVARIRDPAGRLSDFDVQAALDTFGMKSNDKKIIAAAIADRVAEVIENANNFIESSTGKRPSFSTLKRPAGAEAKSKLKRTMTIEELEERARGAR